MKKKFWVLLGILILITIAGANYYVHTGVQFSPTTKVSNNWVQDLIEKIWGPSRASEDKRIREIIVPAKPGDGTIVSSPGNKDCNQQSDGWNNCYSDSQQCGGSGSCMKTCICDRIAGCKLSLPISCYSGMCKAGKGDGTGCLVNS